jgi:hypothetical protein
MQLTVFKIRPKNDRLRSLFWTRPAELLKQTPNSNFRRLAPAVKNCRLEMLFAAVHESLVGTFETCQLAQKLSAYRGSPEVICA